MLLELLLLRNVLVSAAHLFLLLRDNFIDPYSWAVNFVLWGVYFYAARNRKNHHAGA